MVQRQGLVSTILAGCLFGTTVPVIKLVLNSNVSPELFLELRFAIASAVILLFVRGRGWVRSDLLRSRPIWIVGFVNAIGYVTQFEGQALTSSSTAALIISTAALMIPILSLVYAKEKLVKWKILGVVIDFIGTALVVSRGQAIAAGSAEFEGDLLIIFTAVTIALVFVLSKKIVDSAGGRPVTGGMLLITALFALPAVLLDQPLTINVSVTDWAYIAYLSVIATVAAYYFFMRGLESVSPTVSSIILPIEVIVAVALSVVLFQDPFNAYSATGAILIVSGVALVSTSK